MKLVIIWNHKENKKQIFVMPETHFLKILNILGSYLLP